MKDGKRVEDYWDWVYRTNRSSLYVIFNPGKTAVIAIQCYSDDRRGRCPSMAGVTDGASEQELVRRLGPADESRIRGLLKTLYYRTLGIRLTLTEDQVYILHPNDPNYRCKELDYLPSRDCANAAM